MARASGSYPDGRWFDSTRRYHFFIKEHYGSLAQLGEHLPYKQRVIGSSPITPTICGLVVQLVRMPACHAGGRRFEPVPGRQLFFEKNRLHKMNKPVCAVMHKINKPVCAGNFAQYKACRMSIEGHVPVYVTENE